MLKQVLQYVDEVVEGQRPGDPAVCRFLADALATVPHFKASDFQQLFNSEVQDVLLITYLSNLVRTQVALGEKLGTAQLPLV